MLPAEEVDGGELVLDVPGALVEFTVAPCVLPELVETLDVLAFVVVS